jgi:hypothetical protein
VIIFILGEKGPGIKERIAALHKERHRESGLRISMEFNQPIMRFGDTGSWISASMEPEIRRRPAPKVSDPTEDPFGVLEDQLTEEQSAKLMREKMRELPTRPDGFSGL